MSTSAEDALSRAKAIAARLSGGNSTTEAPESPSSAARPTKRKRWGVAPSAVTQEVLPGLADATKKLKQSSSKRLWVNRSAERPESHFYSFFDRGFKLQAIGDRVNRTRARDRSTRQWGDFRRLLRMGERGKISPRAKPDPSVSQHPGGVCSSH